MFLVKETKGMKLTGFFLHLTQIASRTAVIDPEIMGHC